MSKYSDENCRNCGLSDWTWSDKSYPEGRKRIVVQNLGTCRAGVSEAGEGRRKEPLDARRPFDRCSSWQLVSQISG
jgi:hypothetical protein